MNFQLLTIAENMKYALLFFLFFFITRSYAQHRITYTILPDWDINISKAIRAQQLKSDSVYFFKKRRTKDSVLLLIQYFDSLGNVVERDEFNIDGKPYKISNYTYEDTLLVKKEILSRNTLVVEGSDLSKIIKTFTHDSAGNTIEEKDYSFFGDSLKYLSLTTHNREYDDARRVIKEFETLPQGKKYLRHTYTYSYGRLTEVKTYDTKEQWMYSYVYEFDVGLRIQRIYLLNKDKSLRQEFFYDEENRLVSEKNHDEFLGSEIYITEQTYLYSSNGLLESQSYETPGGEHFLYKHHYSR